MDIKPPPQFNHAGQLRAYGDRADPRSRSFHEEHVDIDLRDCEFVRPGAALWCAVFPALARKRGSGCRLLVPLNLGVSIYLKSLGLFALLKELGVEVDDRGVREQPDENVILPITRFATTADASAVTNAAFAKLQASGRAAANLAPFVTELFSEFDAQRCGAQRVGSGRIRLPPVRRDA